MTKRIRRSFDRQPARTFAALAFSFQTCLLTYLVGIYLTPFYQCLSTKRLLNVRVHLRYHLSPNLNRSRFVSPFLPLQRVPYVTRWD